MIWLGYLAKGFYRNKLGSIVSATVNWPAAIGFYLVYIVGILIFAVIPALERDSALRAALFGALFGFFTYATYDLTNLATIKEWPLRVAVVDIIWGAALCTTVATFSFYIAKWLD